MADQPVAFAHQAQLALRMIVCKHVPAVWVRVCVGVVRVQVVFTDVVQVSQVSAGVAAGLRRADGVQAGVAGQLGEAGATVAGSGALRRLRCTGSVE